MLNGDNRLLKRAENAKNRTEIAGLKEEAMSVVTGRQIDRTAGIPHTASLEADLKKELKNVEVVPANGLSDVCYVTQGNLEITVYDDGEIQEGKTEIWDGQKISSPEFKEENGVWNWYIYTPSQLKFLADFVNASDGDGTKLPDSLKDYVKAEYQSVTMTPQTTIHLMNNLDLGARQTNGTKTAGTEWISIGEDNTKVKDKLGTFEGNNHIIKGIYINNDKSFQGLFGNSNAIKNLTIKDSYIKGGLLVGGIVARIRQGEINNCHNVNTTIESIRDDLCYSGGIVGQMSASTGIYNCTNSGEIKGNGSNLGGITGSTLSGVTIGNCTNKGNIEGGTKSCYGGITGLANARGCIIGCTNKGDVTGCNSVGGIAGENAGSIDNCVNEGNINTDTYQAGGIAGVSGAEKINTKITNCINKGRITGKSMNIGGIVGWSLNLELSKCCNSGVIMGALENVGGICGIINLSTFEQCYNEGNVTGKTMVGGIVGRLNCTSSNDSCTVTKCYNKGKIMGTLGNSEIIGYMDEGKHTLNNLYYLKKDTNIKKAIGNQDDNTELKIMEVNEDLNYERFKIWIEEQ